jgi:hypothetical protein
MNLNSYRIASLLFAFVWLALPLSGCASRSATPSKTPLNPQGETTPVQSELVIERPADSALPGAADLVAAYNTRNFGSPGWRSVHLELITEGTLTRSFTVINLWKSEVGKTRTLFLLQKPEGLSGTNYLLTEGETAPESLDMRVHLFLPAGRRQVLEIEPSNFNEGLLGSDFTYTDLRMKLPVQGYGYRIIGQSVIDNEPVWVLEAEPESEAIRRATSWSLARFYLARNFQFLLGADYFNRPEEAIEPARPAKRMRVEKFEQNEGVWTATRIVMFGSTNRYSVLTLRNAHFTVSDIGSEIFLPEKLPLLADQIRQGWSPENLQAFQR